MDAPVPEPLVRIPPAAIKAYDIRGTAGQEITARGAHALGLSYARAARAQGRRTVGVARDGRLSSPALESALLNGLTAGGLEAVRLGIGPTPMLSFAIEALGLDGGVMVTASHNPPHENGFKLRLGDERVHGERLRDLACTAGGDEPGGQTVNVDPRLAYIGRLRAAAGDLDPRTKIAWDCGNGAVASVLPQLVKRLAGEHVLLHARVDGRFPGHHPDPAVAANLADLQRVVRSENCDLGIAFDGDGDRIGVVDRTGIVIWPDQLLLFFALRLLENEPGAAIVGDVKSSRVLFDGVRAAGGRPVMAPSGYVHVRAAALRERAALAGELSGHIFWPEAWDTSDDALYSAMRLIAAAGPGGEALAAFRNSLPAMAATPELRLPCSAERIADAIQMAVEYAESSGARVERLDGVRATTDEGWWLLRASGTEAKLTLRCEATSEVELMRFKSLIGAVLARSGVTAVH